MEQLLEKNDILIISGEGSGPGVEEQYEGARTVRAIKARLTKERAGGDRWAKALVYSHETDGAAVFVNVETGEQCGN